MVAPSDDRLIPLEAAFNFRDLGGYPTADGRRVRWRTLYRADGLSRLTEHDVEVLDELGIATVIDLRTVEELEEQGRVPEVGTRELAFHHLPLFDVLPTQDEMVLWDDIEFVARRYHEMMRDGTTAITRSLGLLADPASHPAVFHCRAGKDRTGILAALVLGLLGVPEDHIVADYALSQSAMQRMLDQLKIEHPDRHEELEKRRGAIVNAVPEVMAGLLATIRETYGSFEGYAAELGVGGVVDDLRAALLEPGPE
jgi:protein-tyrosine phosphatase